MEKLGKKFEMSPQTKADAAGELIRLTSDEEKKLKVLFFTFDTYNFTSGEDAIYHRDKTLFDISQMGEKIVPFLISDDGKVYRDLLGTNLRSLLETVVTEKTAPLVLSAMEEGRIGFWFGALAATKMGKESLIKLGSLLENLKPGSSDGRSGQVRLVEAISTFGDDGAIPFLKKFFENVERAEREEGYTSGEYDAVDILRALIQINTPAAKAYIKELSASIHGDYIKDLCKSADHTGFWISPIKFDVIQPPQKTSDLPKVEKKVKELTSHEKFFLEVDRENPGLRPFIEGKLTLSQSLAEVIRNRPDADYIHIAKLLEDEGSPENKMRAGFLIGQYASFITQTANVAERRLLWRSFARQALDFQDVLMDKKSKAAMTYHQIKEILFGGAIGDKNGQIRKEITEDIIKLAQGGNDAEISKTLGQIVRQFGRQAKGGKAARLNPSQELALRGLFLLKDANSDSELARLLINEEVDPRLKKLCLKKLKEKEYFFYDENVQNLLEQYYFQSDSRKIPWGELIFPIRVNLIADKEMRDEIRRGILPQFIGYFSSKGTLMHRTWMEFGRHIPPELFVVCWVLTDGKKEHMEYMDKMFGGIKSKAARESYLLAFAEFRRRYAPHGKTCFQQMLSMPKDMDFPKTMLRILTNSVAIMSLARKDKIRDLFFSAKNPAVLSEDIEKEARDEFLGYLDVGESDVSSKTIRRLMESMSDPRPFFVYASNMRTSEARTRELFKEIIRHLDHPTLHKWKEWKYSRSDRYGESQLEKLSNQQVQAYARDRFVEAEELLVSILPTEKASNIRESVMHGFLHDDHWKLEGDKSSLRFVFAYLNEFLKTCPAEEAPFIEAIRAKIGHLNHRSDSLNRFQGLFKDEALSARAEETINRFKRQKDERVQRLRSLGLKGDESDGDLESIKEKRGRHFSAEDEKTAELLEKKGMVANYLKLTKRFEYLKQKNEKGEEKRGVEIEINNFELEFRKKLGSDFGKKIEAHRFMRSLSALRQPEFDPDFSDFLKNWNLSETSTGEQISQARALIQSELTDMQRLELDDIRDFFGAVPGNAKEAREAAQNINIARNILRLTALTPHLIVFDRISQDLPKKSLSLSKVIEDLYSKFAAYPKLSQDFFNVKEKLQEISAPYKEEKMAIVVTDHPLVGLTIGKYPYGAESCQSYWHGTSELLAYMADASVKFNLLIDIDKLPEDLQEILAGISPDDEEARMKVFNENVDKFLPAVAARRVLKIVEDLKNGKPYCFLEPVYTPLDRQSIAKHMDNFAKTILVPDLGFAVVKGVKFGEKTGFDVQVAESRNGSQYEDGESGGPGGGGGGLGVKTGSYTMPAKFLE